MVTVTRPKYLIDFIEIELIRFLLKPTNKGSEDDRKNILR